MTVMTPELLSFNAQLQERRITQRALMDAALATAGIARPHPMGLRVPCPLCNARVGRECVKRTGSGQTRTHQVRLRKNVAAQHGRNSKLIMLKDDPRFGLKAGDVLIGHPYRYDSKWTIVCREFDGYDPECNQYTSDVAWVAWA